MTTAAVVEPVTPAAVTPAPSAIADPPKPAAAEPGAKTPEQIAADQAAADAAAAAANAGKTPEQLVAEAVAAETARMEGLEPKAPEKYELQLPAETSLTADDLTAIQADAKALGLTQKQAEKYVTQEAARVKAVVEQVTREYDDIKNDPVLGGANFDTTLKHVQTGIAYLFGEDAPAVRQFLQAWNLQNNKLLLKGFVKLGKLRAEDSPLGRQAPVAAAGEDTRSDGQVLYKKTYTE